VGSVGLAWCAVGLKSRLTVLRTAKSACADWVAAMLAYVIFIAASV
jgi:hypothetical protein